MKTADGAMSEDYKAGDRLLCTAESGNVIEYTVCEMSAGGGHVRVQARNVPDSHWRSWDSFTVIEKLGSER